MPQLIRDVKKYYKARGRRHLPWRSTHDPYLIVVSELMLQQTQAERVIPKYNSFVKKFPNWHALANAKLSDVLKEWQGLGYNRRAKYLHDAAKCVASQKRLGFGSDAKNISWDPNSLRQEFLLRLPGIGPYTAAAVAVFAYNTPAVFIETNIRTVFLYYCFTKRGTKVVEVADSAILPLIAKALKLSGMQPRNFYAALMDYGAHLKAQGLKLNSRSKHYVRQGRFKGSTRELRGAIVRELLIKPMALAPLTKNLSKNLGEVKRELERLMDEGLLTQRGHQYQVVS